MVRIILAVIAGFFAWSILWVGSEQVFMRIWPEWYGAHQLAFEKAVFNKTEFTPDTTILLMNIVRGGIIFSIMSGFLTAFIAGENKKSPLILGVLLLAFGLVIAALSWNYVPIWYNAVFMVLLVPMTILGGKLKKTA